MNQKEVEYAADYLRQDILEKMAGFLLRIRKRRSERVNPQGIAYVFPKQEKWPCRYHLDILAYTESWLSEENSATLPTGRW